MQGGSEAGGKSAKTRRDEELEAPRKRAGRPIETVRNPNGGALTPGQVRLVRRRLHNRESAKRSRQKRQASYDNQTEQVPPPLPPPPLPRLLALDLLDLHTSMAYRT